jgi:ADP-ribosylglycohydrolase
MLGAIMGDIVGSIYEFGNIKSKDFDLFDEKSFFTDDTVLTVATADCILHQGDYATYYRDYALRYPGRGYGANFIKWVDSGDLRPYYSFGNGSAMRVGPVGWAYNSQDSVLEMAKKSSEATHNHPEGIKGAQATALAIYLARIGKDKTHIKKTIEEYFDYDLSESVDEIREWYYFDATCPKTVPQAIICFMESVDFEDAIRNAISIGGDSDTVAAIAGAVSEAYYKGVPKKLMDFTLSRLDTSLLDVVERFIKKYNIY